MNYKYKITLFTPTYNRAYILETLYRSVQRQTYRDFEWIILDDGSEDNTCALVDKWIKDRNDFEIRYFKQKNGGKCRAINCGLDLADGELFFVMDSDDYLTDDALEKVVQWFDTLEDPNIKGIVANRGYASDQTENYCFREKYIDKSLLEIYTFYENGRQVFDGERAFIFYTEFHRKYRYPEYEGENFMTEAVVWNRMARDGYKMRYVNDVIWIFEYKEDGLTMAGNALFLKNPRGYGLCLREKACFLNVSFREKIKMYYTFTCDLGDLHSVGVIAESIGTSRGMICFCKIIHGLSLLIKGRKK